MPDDGNRYETVHGELLVTPSPRLWDQELVFRLHVALTEYRIRLEFAVAALYGR